MFIQVPRLDNTNYSDTYEETLSGGECDALVRYGYTGGVYMYITGAYTGSGVGLFEKDGLWYSEDLGHCSCYGPTASLCGSSGTTDIKSLIDKTFTPQQIDWIKQNTYFYKSGDLDLLNHIQI